jgi:hypothetical protein
MGFDLIGVKPTTKNGEYFRNNVWYWKPLWEFVTNSCKEEMSDEAIKMGIYNDGYKIDDKTAKAIGNNLKTLLKDGEVTRYVTEREKLLAGLSTEDCEWCEGTGETKNNQSCGACKGKGVKKHFATWYSLNEGNVDEFADFCLESGGFEIW